MPEEPVLIAALSGRALAASAKRAGYRPLVVDCFGDQDLACNPSDKICLPARMRVGLRSKPLIKALSVLQSKCDQPIKGLILGSGFEDRPGLIDKLAAQFPLLGTDADTIAALKDPAVFFDLLDKLAIAHPETNSEAPSDPNGWLRKRIGGSGGLHIKRCTQSTKSTSKTYFQRDVFQHDGIRHDGRGQAVSVLAIAGKGGRAFALSKQWPSPAPQTPFRYGGAVSHIELPRDQETAVLEAALAITEAADLKGLASIDFLITADGVFCLEINPRPGATLDVHDDPKGSLFQAHIIACQGGDPAAYLQENWASPRAKACAVLYADQGSIRIETKAWPDWISDRPQNGVHLARGQPLASVHAEGTTAEQAEELCISRLASLEKMLYDSPNTKDQSI